MLVLSAAMPASHAQSMATQFDPGPVQSTDFVEWVAETRIPFKEWALNPELEGYLDAALEGKRIIFIAEPDHFFEEKYHAQEMLIRYLVTKGYRHVFHEGFGAGTIGVADEYIRCPRHGPEPCRGDDRTGRELLADLVLYGGFSPDRSRLQRCQTDSQRRFLDALREINATLDPADPLRMHALDIDMIRGACRIPIRAMLREHSDAPELDELRELIAKDPGLTVQQELARARRIHQIVTDDSSPAAAVLGRRAWRDLQNHADCLVESIAFSITRREDGVLDRALVRREPAMFRQVMHVMESLPRDARVVMLAHSNHLNKLGEDITRARRPSVGQMIHERFPGEVFVFWTLFDRGVHMNPMADPPLQPVRSDPERIESLLAQAGSTYILPLGTGRRGESYLDEKRKHSYFSWSETSTITKQADALIFIEEITPIREDERSE